MNGLLFFLLVLMLIALTALLLRLRRVHSRQALLQERIRTSDTYRSVRPLLERCRTLRVERIVLRPEGVTITLYDPPGKTLRCIFDEHGLDDATPEPLLALAEAVAADVPMFGDNRRYFFKAHRDETGGLPVRWYEYMIQPHYKDSVLRERYDRMDA